jgi:GntR family transcriptional repressor for pyruvate dehydrogenase complex
MRVLIGDITRGEYRPGERLPRETDLAEQFEVSRGVARECLRGLEERGLVRVKHGRGAIVTPPEEWDTFDPDVLEALLRGADGGRVLTGYLECRRILEVEAAGLAAERAGDRHHEALGRAFEDMRTTAERARVNPAVEDRYHEADIAFHRELIRATGNQALGRITEPIHRALSAALRRLARPEFRFERGLPEHERVLAAIAAGDVQEARAAMADHLATVEHYLQDFLGHSSDELTTVSSSD